jgi:hypothetical protein
MSSLESDSNALQGGGDAAGSSIELLSAILNDIGASEFLQRFIIDDQEDDCILPLGMSGRMRPEQIAGKYGLPLELAQAFLDKCRETTGALRPDVLSSKLSSISSVGYSLSSSPAIATALSLVDDISVLRKINLEHVCTLGKGGFGTVYKCKDIVQKRFVAVKLVIDPKNAQAAKREGQKLLRVKHKNIVLMHRVIDLSPVIGSASCALEMEVVAGGDLSILL